MRHSGHHLNCAYEIFDTTRLLCPLLRFQVGLSYVLWFACEYGTNAKKRADFYERVTTFVQTLK